MPKIIKHTLLQYLPSNFSIETSINPERIFNLNNKPVKKGIVIYLCERELRAKDNFALQFAIQKAKELNSSLKIIYPEIYYEHKPKQNFINEQINFTKEIFLKSGFDFEIFKGSIKEYLKKIKSFIIDY